VWALGQLGVRELLPLLQHASAIVALVFVDRHMGSPLVLCWLGQFDGAYAGDCVYLAQGSNNIRYLGW
jgi:hypothetical protein